HVLLIGSITPFPEKLIATIRGMGYSFVAVKK
ncbi:hypothetical protein, partial [Shigella dysenteriae]